MKRLLTFVMTAVMLVGSVAPLSVNAAENVSKMEESTENIINYNEVFNDEQGNTVEINVYSQGNDINSLVYVNGELTQKAIINYEQNEIIYTDFQDIAIYSSTTRLASGIYSCSEFIQDVETEKLAPEESEISTYAFDTSGWSYYGYYPATPSYYGSKPCRLYFYNFDEDPYDNRYLVKNVSAGIGTPISIIAGTLGMFLTGGITLPGILATLGTAVVADVITNAISGEVCYSTQKIQYAPVIAGVNIFADAYITKRYVVTYNKLNGNRSYSLDREAYDFNRGETPDLIALNAQICERGNRY